MIHLELSENEARIILRAAELSEAVLDALFDHPCDAPKERRLAISKLASALERQESHA